MINLDEELNLSKYNKYIETEELIKKPQRQYKPDNNKNNILKETLSFLAPIIIALLLAVLLKSFVFINAEIPTGSMKNTIPIDTKVIASRLSYIGKAKPERYDIVIFKYPDDEKQLFTKRVIGLPGEKVEIINGKVYIDDSAIPLDDNFVTVETPKGNFGPYYVPDGSYFMLGDNRENSKDSRYWVKNYVDEEKILGKVKFSYSPKFEKIE